MTKSPLEQSGWSRRRFIQASTAAAGLGLMPRRASAQAAPWAVRPSGNPSSVTFVVWQYGNIYQQIAQQFEHDWGVKINQIIEPNVEPQVAKLTAMYAAGDAVDVSLSPMQYLASYIEQGIAQPIDGLPGVDQYVKDFTPFTRAIAQRDGKTWGLPYFSTVWTFIYNDEMLAKAGFKDRPFKSYPELIEQAKKAKRDGAAKYPILWVAGAGFEQLPATWFSMTYNRGGIIFDRQLAPQLGPGSIARETLRWWQSTFKEELADPNSLNLRFIPAVKAFNAGQHVYLGTLHHYYLSLVNDQAQSPIAGKGRTLALPGDGKTIGYTMLYVLFRRLGLLNSLTGVISAEVGFLMPYAVLILVPYFASLPSELEDAARIDGCTRFAAFLRIVLPLSTPGLAACGVIMFIISWHELLIPLILLNKPEFMTLPVVLAGLVSDYFVFFTLMMAICLLGLLPTLALVLGLQKYVVRGLVAGAVKG
jgi:hypothetical protein